jgi:hypothetical protein
MRLFKMAVLSLAALAAAFGAEVSGKWTAEMQGRDGQARTMTFNLKAEGEKLTGTVSGGMGAETQISDGKVSGDEVSFNVVREFNGNTMVMKYTGKVEGNEMKLKMSNDRMPQPREIVAKRAVS